MLTLRLLCCRQPDSTADETDTAAQTETETEAKKDRDRDRDRDRNTDIFIERMRYSERGREAEGT
jgi:hypothetical protein